MPEAKDKKTKQAAKERIVDLWQSLSPKQKNKAIVVALIIIVVLIVSFSGKKQTEKVVYKEKSIDKPEMLVLEPEFTEEDLLSKFDNKFSAIEDKMNSLALENEQLKEQLNSTDIGSTIVVNNKSQKKDNDDKYPAPPPPIKQSSVPLFKPKEEKSFGEVLLTPNTGSPSNEPRFIGGIQHIQGTQVPKTESKKKNEVYLPPSLIPAKLITGIKAHTIKGAKKNPSLVMLRIQKPAILPNYVKAQLKGCFVIAEGYGRLDTQRIELRTVSLSCLGKKGESLIDQEIDGFVVDSDGSVGLAGHVYSHMDESIGYAFAAGAFAGFGRQYSYSKSSITTSGLGSVTTVDPNKALSSSFGQGIADSSSEIKDIYLDIVKQAAPVIEVGPTKNVDIVISKGVYLKIKEWRQ